MQSGIVSTENTESPTLKLFPRQVNRVFGIVSQELLQDLTEKEVALISHILRYYYYHLISRQKGRYIM